MSRRRGEFEHRTSIFEGAFRAWSHLGGLDPEDLESQSAAELDPLTNPIENDSRISSRNNNDNRREYPYEPLPRAGLAHPYVQAILSPWLGPDADNEAIQLGLTTLRTWWQHRRKGESGSAVAALGTEKMKGVVEGYTRHFFTLAHCLVVNDKEQPPRTLHTKMRELEKSNAKKNKNRKRDDSNGQILPSSSSVAGMAAGTGGMPVGGPGALPNSSGLADSLAASITADLTDSNLSPLERLHLAQQRQLKQGGSVATSSSSMDNNNSIVPTASSGTENMGVTPIIDMKGKCIPGKIDLPGVVDAVSRQASQLAHRGTSVMPAQVVSSSSGSGNGQQQQQQQQPEAMQIQSQYGDPNTIPVVFVSNNGAIQICMKVDGITCAHCVKIVETVLRGCNGNGSPISGLLDAAADRSLNSVLIRIDKASNAKRISFESARNLAMVGYTAKVREMSIVGQGADRKSTMDLGALSTAFEVVANADAKDVFDWSVACTCPDNGVLRSDCARHSQMNTRIFEAFDAREEAVKEYMAGCGMKIGLPCTCGPECRCKNCPIHSGGGEGRRGEEGRYQQQNSEGMQAIDTSQPMLHQQRPMDPPLQPQQQQQQQQQQHFDQPLPANIQPDMFDGPIQVDQPMNFFGMEQNNMNDDIPPIQVVPVPAQAAQMQMMQPNHYGMDGHGRAQRNPSIISYGNNGLRHMSITSGTSSTTFGRAMSGLSALSIDWENLEDFDLEVDLSDPNNANNPVGAIHAGGKRPSIRRPYPS